MINGDHDKAGGQHQRDRKHYDGVYRRKLTAFTPTALAILRVVTSVGAWRLWENTIINLATATNNHDARRFPSDGRAVMDEPRRN